MPFCLGTGFDESVPLIAHPEVRNSNGTPVDWIVIQFYCETIRARILPTLVRRYFGGPIGLDFNVAVIATGNPTRIIYSSSSWIWNSGAALNGPNFFNGALLGSESIGQQVRRAGGYVAIVGKKGPTFTFDDSVNGDPAMGVPIAANNFIFVSDDCRDAFTEASSSPRRPGRRTRA